MQNEIKSGVWEQTQRENKRNKKWFRKRGKRELETLPVAYIIYGMHENNILSTVFVYLQYTSDAAPTFLLLANKIYNFHTAKIQ